MAQTNRILYTSTLRVNYDNLQDDMLAYLFFEALTGLWVASVVGEWLGSTFCVVSFARSQ